MGRTATVSAYIAEVTQRELDDTTARRARLHLLDTLAAIVACRHLEPARAVRRYLEAEAGVPGATGATVLGTDVRAPVVDAIFAGAITAHAAEINDFMPSVFVQPGPAVVATAIAVGQRQASSGDEVLRAIAAGYELAYRIPWAVGVGNLRRAGLATHGVGPCFGAAAAASALLRLPAPLVGHVLSLTAQQAAGSWQWLLDVEHMEKAFVFGGLGARNGAQAALLVAAGFRGVPDVIDRAGSWFTSPAFADDAGDGDLDRLVDGLGDGSAFEAAAVKRYPVGGPTQPAVEALLELAPSAPADDVELVEITMPGRWEAFRDAAMPALNLRYLAAIILLDGHLDFVAAQSLERMHTDAAVAALMSRVTIDHDPRQEAAPGHPRTESARVVVHLLDGRRLERYVPHVVGYPSHPMSAADVEAKATALVEPHLGRTGAERLVAACRAPASAEQLASLVGGP